jgi:hypothetical protein
MTKLIYEGMVAGVQFYEGKNLPLELGTVLTLVPEPSNPYDEHAIKVMVGDIQLGHIPRISTQPIHTVFANNQQPSAQITYIDSARKTPLIIIAAYAEFDDHS